MCAIARESQSKFSIHSKATDLATSNLLGQFPQSIIERYLRKFHINKELNDFVLKDYIEQFYIHLAQDLRTHSDSHYELSLRLVSNQKEKNHVFYYILGFEILKMIFQMSWLQHERLYGLQKNQDSFINNYIKPIQNTHRINGIIVPRHENIFFAKRNYFVKKPCIKEKKLTELVMATFTTDTVKHLGFLMIRHLNFLVFDYAYIFNDEPETLFFL
ncbi:MAG TPA: cobyrinic acid a,c-diamide synthase [Stenomitos sp.]